MVKYYSIMTAVLMMIATGRSTVAFFKMPDEFNSSRLVNITLDKLSKTEMQLVTYGNDAKLLPQFWHSVELFVPKLMGIVIIYGEEDADELKGIVTRTVISISDQKIFITSRPSTTINRKETRKVFRGEAWNAEDRILTTANLEFLCRLLQQLQ